MIGYWHNTTGLFGEQLKRKEKSAKSQQAIILEILKAYRHQGLTRQAIQNEYKRRTGKDIAIASASRALGNLTAVKCPRCLDSYSNSETPGCPRCRELWEHDWPKTQVIKSDMANARGTEGVSLHWWKWNGW